MVKETFTFSASNMTKIFNSRLERAGFPNHRVVIASSSCGYDIYLLCDGANPIYEHQTVDGMGSYIDIMECDLKFKKEGE